MARMARSFASVKRARLALEGDFLGRPPRAHAVHAADEPFELRRRDVRRRAAAEVDEVQRPPGDGRLLGVELPLARQDVEISLHLGRVLVGVDAEVAEVTALPAERDVEVEPERHLERPGWSAVASPAPAGRRSSTASFFHTENGG